MNTRISIALSVALLAGMSLTAACGDNNDRPAEVTVNVNATVSPQKLETGPQAADLSLTINADADWAVRCDAGWVSVRPSGGLKDVTSVVTVSVTGNPDMAVRNAVVEIVSGGRVVKSVELTQGFVTKASADKSSLFFGAQGGKAQLTVTANSEWTLSSSADWISIKTPTGNKGETLVEIEAVANNGNSDREAEITLLCGESSSGIKVTQLSDEVNAPEGYTLVWSDEFNTPGKPGVEWVIENWAPGHVNNELQTYTSAVVDGTRTLDVKDGFLNITCFKAADGKIYSGRMNACPNTGWLYGYFEARILLPSGRGTWPAFWMMPSNVDWGANPWPYCGEIDIMEEVGANPDFVSSSLHTGNYNHTKGTQKTHEMKLPGAEGSFHVYACEWTEDEIVTYVDGKVQLRASRASMGDDHASWPFHYPFYPILNLAWGGDWGGYKGIDESALPAVMKVDYVRIFQKK